MQRRSITFKRKTKMFSNGREYNQLNIKRIDYWNLVFLGLFGLIDDVIIYKTHYYGSLKFERKFKISIKEFSKLKRTRGKKEDYIRVHFRDFHQIDKTIIDLELIKLVS